MTKQEIEALPLKVREYIKDLKNNNEYLLDHNQELNKKLESIKEIIL